MLSWKVVINGVKRKTYVAKNDIACCPVTDNPIVGSYRAAIARAGRLKKVVIFQQLKGVETPAPFQTPTRSNLLTVAAVLTKKARNEVYTMDTAADTRIEVETQVS